VAGSCEYGKEYGDPENGGNFLHNEAESGYSRINQLHGVICLMVNERLVELGIWYRAKKFVFFMEPQNWSTWFFTFTCECQYFLQFPMA
jgi:hypothetical protein